MLDAKMMKAAREVVTQALTDPEIPREERLKLALVVLSRDAREFEDFAKSVDSVKAAS